MITFKKPTFPAEFMVDIEISVQMRFRYIERRLIKGTNNQQYVTN